MKFIRPIAAIAALTVVAGCDLPTAAPRWTTLWELPADSSEISVAELLPDNVSVVDAGGTKAFEASLGTVPLIKTLGSVCQPCQSATGQQVPKPEFTIVDSSTVNLPLDVTSIDIVGGTIDYTITNNFSFDPLNPGAGAHGWLKVLIRSGSAVLASDSVAGDSFALERGVPRTHTVVLAGTPASPVRLTGPITVVVTLASPAGDPVTIDSAEEIDVSVTPRAIRASQLDVRVDSRDLPAQSDTIDLSSMNDLNGTIDGGAILLSIRNPFAVGGSLSFAVRAPGGTAITKSLTLPVGGPGVPAAKLRIGLTQGEINSIIGQRDVVTSVSGTVSAPAGAVTVLPTQVIVVTSAVEAAVRLGGN